MMNDMSNIDIKSVVIHKSFAINKSQTIYISSLSLCNKSDKDYNCWVVISGRYKNGERFKRIECKISLNGFRSLWERYGNS